MSSARRKLRDLVHPDDLPHMLSLVSRCASQSGGSARGEWRLSDHEGGWHFTETVIANLLHDPHVQSLVFTSRDVGERVRFQNELEHQAFHDALTGLANRVLFKDRVEHALDRAARTGGKVAVLFMDVDDFKLVNDSYGHVLGDHLLVQAAERLGGVLRTSDTAARLGGDEFAILLEGATDLHEACQVAERALGLFADSFQIETAELTISVSIGVAISNGSHGSAEQLLRDADVAMYSAKAHGKDRFEVFEPAMQVAVHERLELANDLRQAVEREPSSRSTTSRSSRSLVSRSSAAKPSFAGRTLVSACCCQTPSSRSLKRQASSSRSATRCSPRRAVSSKCGRGKRAHGR